MQNENEKRTLSWSPAPQSKGSAPSQPTLTAAKSPPAPHKSPSQTATYAGLLAAGVILGVLISWGWSAVHTAPKVAQTTGTSSTQDTALVPSTTNASLNAPLVVASPQKAGDTVAIASVSVVKPTWVVVYEERGGKPGNALGARLFFSDSKDATINLLRDTTPGQQYLVGESLDSGSRTFSLKDTQVTDEGGNVLWVAFTVQ